MLVFDVPTGSGIASIMFNVGPRSVLVVDVLTIVSTKQPHMAILPIFHETTAYHFARKIPLVIGNFATEK